MSIFVSYVILGLATGSVYALASTGLIVTYATTRVFNFAHGALGMIVTFICWTFWVQIGLPKWVALFLSVFVIAPLIGLVIEVAAMNRLQRVSVAQRFAGTIALFIGLIGLATWLWNSSTQRFLPAIFGYGALRVTGSVRIPYDELGTVVITLVVAIALWVFFHRTRVGIAMRAVIDSQELSELHAINPRTISRLAWCLGVLLAALGAILISAQQPLDVTALSELVIYAFAAAVVGRLTSIPVAFATAIALGVASSLSVGYLGQSNQVLRTTSESMPFLVLFVAVLLLRDRSRALKPAELAKEPKPPRLRTMLISGVVAIAVIIVLANTLGAANALVGAAGLVYAALLLSLVLMTGMAGQVSLCQFSLMGLGVVVLAHLHVPYLLAFVIAVAVCGAVGAILGGLCVKAEGIYLALATLAFAVFMDNVVFSNSNVFSAATGGVASPRPNLAGLSVESVQGMMVLSGIVVVVFAVGLLMLRGSRGGRMLSALRDSPLAANSLGYNVFRSRVVVFAVAAMMAGVTGCLFGGLYIQMTPSDFGFENSLIALLILSIWGVTSVPGAIVGGALYALLYLLLGRWITDPTIITSIQPVGIGLAVMGLAQHPEGVIAQMRNSALGSRFSVQGRTMRRQSSVLLQPAGVSGDSPESLRSV